MQANRLRTATIILGALVVLLIGVVLYLNFAESPQAVILQAFKNFSAAKSYKSEADIKMKGDFSLPANFIPLYNPSSLFAQASQTLIGLHYKSEFVNESKSPKARFLIESLKLQTNIFNFDFKPNLELRFVAGKQYLRIGSIPQLFLSQLGYLQNQWIELKTVPTAQSNLVNNADINKFLKLVKLGRRLADDIIADTDNYHYSLDLDRQAVAKLGPEDASIKEILQNTTVNDWQIWVGKKDKYPHRFLADINIKNKDNKHLNLKLDIILSGFNENIDIQTPAAKTYDQLLRPSIGPSPRSF